MEKFIACKSWARKTAQRFGWRSIALHDEGGSVDVEAADPGVHRIALIITEYEADNVYNMDETGLFFKCLPNRSYVEKKDKGTIRGSKLMKAKDSVTVYVCTNATGTDLVPLSIIGKSANPHCFKNHSKRLQYYNQRKAWSDGATFKKWWNHFLIHIRKITNKPVLLILDNCGPHGCDTIDPMEQVRIEFLPPNCTAMFQPMDAGVIAMIKKNYRYKLLRRMCVIFEERIARRDAANKSKMVAGTKGLKEGHPPHFRDVMDILYEVWEEVSPEKLKKCWVKSQLIHFSNEHDNEPADVAPTSDDEEVENNEMEDLIEIASHLNVNTLAPERTEPEK